MGREDRITDLMLQIERLEERRGQVPHSSSEHDRIVARLAKLIKRLKDDYEIDYLGLAWDQTERAEFDEQI